MRFDGFDYPPLCPAPATARTPTANPSAAERYPVSLSDHSDTELAAVVVGLTVLGMVTGTYMHLFGPDHEFGWLLFTLSFGAWMAAAIVLMLVLWDAGYLDR